MKEIKLWSIDGHKVIPINQASLDYENRLEKWLLEDISILSSDLAVIGSQVITDFGGKIDILAINSIGEVVIIELKRDKTYREVISQVLDYATYVEGLDYEDLNKILDKLDKNNDIEYEDIADYFALKFNKDSDDIEFNSDHKMLIVGSEINDSTVRIIDYLSSEPYSVNINAVNFNYFKDKKNNEFLAQSFVKPELSITEEGKNKKYKKKQSIITSLFQLNKLKVGDKVYLKPAVDQGHDKNSVTAQIVNQNQSCLQPVNDDSELAQLYSFSKLRRIWTHELKLEGVKPYWGFGLRFDWAQDKDGVTKDLSQILQED